MIQEIFDAATGVLPHFGETVATVAAVLGTMMGREHYRNRKNGGNPHKQFGEIKEIALRIDQNTKRMTDSIGNLFGDNNRVIEVVGTMRTEVINAVTDLRVEVAKLDK